MGEIGKQQYYRTLRFWGGGSAYVVWEGCGWSGVGEVNDSGADLDIYRLLAKLDFCTFIITCCIYGTYSNRFCLAVLNRKYLCRKDLCSQTESKWQKSS